MRVAVAALALLWSACSNPAPRTQVMVELDVEPALATAERLVIEVFGGAAAEDPANLSRRFQDDRRRPALVFPWRVALVPLAGDEGPRQWRLTATLADGAGAPLSALALRGGYAEGRTVLLRAVFEAACAGVACPVLEGCAGGACADSAVDVVSLPDLPEPAP